jgi:hypothetical protein
MRQWVVAFKLKYTFVNQILIMKKIAALVLLLASAQLAAQVKLNDKDFKNLVALAQAYAGDVNANSDGFDAKVKELSTPKLKHVVETLTLLDGNDKALLTPKYLGRPTNEELQLWYVIKDVQHKRVDSLETRSDEQIAKDVLAKKIDERLMVHNYYRHLEGGMGFLSNTMDMSGINIDIDKLGLKNDTEKGIFFLNMSHGLITRFRVLNQMKNPSKLLEFADKLPTFNGQPYYKFTGFGYTDFEYTNDVETTMYNRLHVNDYYEALMSHFMAIAGKADKEKTRDLYFNSILTKPEFFKYSTVKDMLQEVYEDAMKD